MSEENRIETKVFSAFLPKEFSLVQQLPTTAVAVAEADENSMQPPRITISVSLQSAYNAFEGADIKEKFFNALPQSRFKAVVTDTQETIFKEHVCYIANGKTDAEFNGEHYHLFYFFACIVIDDECCIEFISEAEEKVRAEFEPLFNEVWRSLAWENDAERLKHFLQEQEDMSKAMLKTMDEPTPEILTVETPLDGKEIFEIGDFSFDIIQEESSWQIPEFSKELNTRIAAKTNEVKRAIKAKLLDDYIEGNVATVHIDFPGIGVYQGGIPKGDFEIKEDKCEPIYAYVRKEGFEYRLDFFGTISFKDNWVAYNGYLKPPYDDKPCFPVKIYKKFDAETLDWGNYKFTSYEETLQAPPEVVRYLYLTNPDFDEIPDRVFSFVNLKELVIACKWPLEKLPLKSLSEKIGSLQHLEQIAINGTHIETLPESIGELKKLTRFYFNNGMLKTVPERLFQLPGLEHLTLSGHQLETLPQQAHLPVIKSLNLSNNRLKTLPAALLRQGNINHIDLVENLLETLPEEISKIPSLDMSIEDKKRLMDFDYKGADGKGTITWNDTIFFAKNDIQLIPQIETIFEKHHVVNYREALLSLVKKSIAFKLIGKEDYITIGNHRFGGMPDLPEDIGYPKFKQAGDPDQEHLYEFIAQVNCEQISDLQDYLPRKGMLFFFLETIHNIYGRSVNNPCKVIYVPDLTTLKSGKRFQFSQTDYYEMYDPAYLANKADAVKEISFPSFYASYANKYLFKGDAASLQNNEDISDNLFDEGANKKEYQHTINAYGFTQHESPELQTSLKLKGNPEDWIILLKVSSAGDFMWGDAGDLFFVIHKSDLSKDDFSNVFITTESS